MHILMASSEMTPFAHTGGLGDVLGALPKALIRFGHQVSVVLPLFATVDRNKYRLEQLGDDLSLSLAGKQISYNLRKTVHENITVYFVDKPEFYDRSQLYGDENGDYPDNFERFSFFCRAVVETAATIQPGPHIIHCHDWQSGLIPAYLKFNFRQHDVLKSIPSVCTIHNIGYQGNFTMDNAPSSDLPDETFGPRGFEFYKQFSFLKGNIIYADAVTTVSSRYAREIQTPEYGAGLEGVMKNCRDKLFGILNGVDYDEWNPATDQYIEHRYTPEDYSAKKHNKEQLQREFGLPVRGDVPVIGMVTRLTGQKGMDLMPEAMERLMSEDIQLVVLGNGEKHYEEMMERFAGQYPDKFADRIAFNKKLSHLVEAGSDFFLMPSRYEPCGLSQIYSLKYGTIPVVRATGGLDDTIIDAVRDPEHGTGFKFSHYNPKAMADCVLAALEFYRKRPDDWQRLIRNAFAADFSWEYSASRYIDVFRRAYMNKNGKFPPRIRKLSE